jgi:hypothetical protein
MAYSFLPLLFSMTLSGLGIENDGPAMYCDRHLFWPAYSPAVRFSACMLGSCAITSS